ncbi:MAG: BTAD domain-containing putative transcriptional regulator [Aquabacterium sp.]
MGTAPAALRILRAGIRQALVDPGQGRAELSDAVARLRGPSALRRRRAPGVGHPTVAPLVALHLACAAQLVFMSIADDDYAGFELAAATLADARPPALDAGLDADQSLLLRAGQLVAARFNQLDAPDLSLQAQALVEALGDARAGVAARCCAGLVALDYHHMRMDLEGVLWMELALRPIRRDPALATRLADEAFHMLVQALYLCEAPGPAQALRAERAASGPAPLPAIALKLHLLDAQMALGAGDAEAGHAALDQAHRLLHPAAPRPAGWWHLLRSRLALLQGRHRQALVHARLARRLSVASHLPERWMGVTVMQEGQVHMADGAPHLAWPFFERAGRAASGAQARFCHSLAHLAHALHHLERGETVAGRSELAVGLAMARELAWLQFFRAVPAVAAALCAHALALDVEPAFVQEVIAARRLNAVRADLAAWPWPIRIRMLGLLRIEIHGQALAFRGKVARKPLELLQFIIAASASEVSTTSAGFALWPDLDGDKAQAALTAALHRLRKLLGDDRAVLLELGRLSLDTQRVWVDCLAFEALVDRLAVNPAGDWTAAQTSDAERALALYGGAFVPVDDDDASWKAVYRNRLASQCRRLVRGLARAAISSGRHDAARALLERGLELDPLAEDLARELMLELADRGDKAAALAVFERSRASVAALGVTSATATLALRDRILGGGTAG